MGEMGDQVKNEIHTDYDIRLRSFFLQNGSIFNVANCNAHVGERLFDRLGLFFSAHERRVTILGMFVVEGIEDVTTNVAGCARAVVI
jgi:hypothetical protein